MKEIKAIQLLVFITIMNMDMNMDMNSRRNSNITKHDYKFIDEALEVAKSSTMLMKHGCVVVENNKIIARGWNNYRNRFHNNFIGDSCSCHAEMHALHQVLRMKTKGKSSPSRKRVGQRQKWEREV